MDAEAGQPPPPPLGQLLAQERERQGLSRTDAAQRLHMSASQVEALENGDYGRLPSGMFLRGFVRNYTRMLGLDSNSALVALAATAPRGAAPGIVVPTQNIRFDPMGERFSSPYVKAWTVAGVAVALGFAAMYWWLFIRPAPPATVGRKEVSEPGPAPRSAAPIPQNLAVAPMPAADTPAPVEAPKEEAAPARDPERPKKPADVVAAPQPVGQTQAAPPQPVGQAPAAPPQPPAQPGARTVHLRFRGSSWVEIRDRSGKVLLSKLNEPGSEAQVSGRPPFSIIVGNAPDVTLTYDDRDFPLEPHTRVAVARFTLE